MIRFGDNNVQNNIFTASALGYALYCNSTTVTSGTFLTSLDYNTYQATTGNFFRYPTTNHTTFAAFQTSAAGNGHAVNSLFGNPGFLTSSDLHVQGPTGSNAGNNAMSTAMDIDGDLRPLSPDVTVDMGADEYNVPPCPAPSAFTFISATATTTDLTWSTGATDTGWIIEWGPTGFTPGTGTSPYSNNDTVTVTGVMPQTDYDMYVRGICNTAGDTSIYIGPLSARTGCVN